MSQKLSQVYKKFLYGGEPSPSQSSLYSSVRTKTRSLELPSTLEAIGSMQSREFPQAAQSFRESLVVPRADDVHMPEVKAVPDPVAVPALSLPTSSKPEQGSGLSSFKQEIAQVESGGNYRAVNPNSSASGKYQFLFKTWKDQIAQVTGIKSKQEFLDNPQAQEKFMDHYTSSTILPGVKALRKSQRAQDFSDSDLAKLIHFQGLNGAKKQLETGKLAQATKTNLSVKEYLRRSKVRS